MTWQIDFTNVCYNVGLVVKKKKKVEDHRFQSCKKP